MKLKPITFKAACLFVDEVHRHHKRPQGHKFSIGVVNESEELLAVVMVGRPLSRYLDDGYTCEVTRLASKGEPNVCSMLYGAAWRAAKGMGYTKIITYILEIEPGTSLKAAGWIKEADLNAQNSWDKRRPDHQGDTNNRTVSIAQGVNKQRWSQSI